MIVQLNFDKANQQRLLPLLEWLREIGLVKSYQVADIAVDGEGFLNRMLENAEKDIAEGNVMTDEEVGKSLNNWVLKDKSGRLAEQPLDTLQETFRQSKKRIASMHLSTEMQQKQMTIAFAAMLYENGIFSTGQAAEFAGIPKSDFIRQLGKFQVSSFGETVEEISAL